MLWLTTVHVYTNRACMLEYSPEPYSSSKRAPSQFRMVQPPEHGLRERVFASQAHSHRRIFVLARNVGL